jgi:redox-sensitive bicupin YhaK (pirin superfamily)
MKVEILRAGQRGLMHNQEFKGYPLFSNGMQGTGRPDRFGAVYVFNDDYLFPGSYVGMHPHANVEVITMMLEGKESHNDSLGHHQELNAGAVQLISSGTNIQHSGGNMSGKDNARHLQIWIAPGTSGTAPSLQLKDQSDIFMTNQWIGQVSPDGLKDTLILKQDAWIFKGLFEKGVTSYALHKKDNGIMVYILEGKINITDQAADKEDTLFITDAEKVEFEIKEDALLILIETVL